jgi:hypothetical protein
MYSGMVGVAALRGDGVEHHCTIITIAESPVNSGIVWVGNRIKLTVDGKVLEGTVTLRQDPLVTK